MSRAAPYPRRQRQDGPPQSEYAVSNSYDPEGHPNQPDKRIEGESQKGHRPAEHPESTRAKIGSSIELLSAAISPLPRTDANHSIASLGRLLPAPALG